MRWRRYEGALHEDESATGASEKDDVNRFVDRGSGCIGRVNETEDFSIELFAVDVAAERAEALELGGLVTRGEMSVLDVKNE